MAQVHGQFHIQALFTDGGMNDGSYPTREAAERAAHEIRLFNKHKFPDLMWLNVVDDAGKLVYALVVNGEGQDWRREEGK